MDSYKDSNISKLVLPPFNVSYMFSCKPVVYITGPKHRDKRRRACMKLATPLGTYSVSSFVLQSELLLSAGSVFSVIRLLLSTFPISMSTFFFKIRFLQSSK